MWEITCFKIFFLEYMIGSCEWRMRYSMPCLRESKAGYVGALKYPQRYMFRYRVSYWFWTVMSMRPPTQWLMDSPCEFSIFQKFSNKRCSHEEHIFIGCVHWERWLPKLYFVFCIFYPMLFNDVFDDMIFVVNTYSILTLDYANVEEI